MKSHHSRAAVAVLAAATVALGFIGVPARAEAAPDPYRDVLWGLDQIHVPAAWEHTHGAGAVVAVIDAGVDMDHPDLAANVVPGITFLDCGDAGCGTGDWESPSAPGNPHGTHVSGTIAAVADNGIGVVGVANEAVIVPVRVLDGEGSGNAPDLASALRWAADRGVDVINMSLGFGPQGTIVGASGGLVTDEIQSIRDAVAYANAAGVVVVAAAGNDFKWVCSDPAWADGALCVTATTRDEIPTGYSNTAVKQDLLSVAGPGGLDPDPAYILGCGEQILSTVPAGTNDNGRLLTECDYADGYAEYSGTSMAAPHVAGVAALLRSMGCTSAQTIDAITTTARKPGTDTRGTWDPQYGYGIVDAEEATAAASGVCERPAPNAAPSTAPDTASTSLGREVSIPVLANDTDADGDTIVLTAAAGAKYGATRIEGDSVVYRPSPAAGGRTDEFTYNVSDGRDGYSTGTVSVSVSGTATVVDEYEPVTLHFQGNIDEGCTGDGRTDMITDGIVCPALAENAVLDEGPAARWAIQSPAALSDADRNVYAPNWAWTLSEPATIGGQVNLSWWASCAGCDFGGNWMVRLYADTSKVIEQEVEFAETPAGTVRYALDLAIPDIPVEGILTLQLEPVYIDTQSDQVIFYDSAQACPGASAGPCDSTMIVSKVRRNTLPIAGDDAVATSRGATVTIGVLGNDADPDFDPIAITAFTTPSGGTLSRAGDAFVYTPDRRFTGVDTFTYTIEDSRGGSAMATVTVSVSRSKR